MLCGMHRCIRMCMLRNAGVTPHGGGACISGRGATSAHARLAAPSTLRQLLARCSSSAHSSSATALELRQWYSATSGSIMVACAAHGDACYLAV
jgi:hypothetical protein